MSPRRNIWTIGLLLATILVSCSPVGREEAEHVVAQADSLRAEGQMYGDSVQLAQAYRTLKRRSFLNFRLSSSYAHACYHYGRLLRAQDDPVSAMQVFIDATHSRTRDYHILGRVYSNMGSICHMAGEFPLAYDMYRLSSNCFLRNDDSLLYYYGLYRGAYELAEQGKKDSCYIIVENIKSHTPDDSILMAYCFMSQAQACLVCGQYDSVLFYSRMSKHYFQPIPSVALHQAQAFSFLGIRDSATYYAHMVLKQTNSLFDRNNALYILTNDDNTKDVEEVRHISALRADTQKLLEIRQGKVSQAVQLLQQDIKQKPDLRGLYSAMVTLFTIGMIVSIYVYRKRKKQQLLAQKVDELATSYSDMQSKRITQIEQNCAIIRASKNLSQELCWKDYEQMCSIVDKHFYFLSTKLMQKQLLNETEIRLCVLVLLDMSRAQIADTLPYSLNSVGKLKDQTAKKLGTTGKNLRNFLENMAIEG